MRMKGFLSALALLAALGFQGADAASAAPVAQIEAALARPDILCGRFDQRKKLVGMKQILLSSGRFCVIAGKGILWRTLQPFPDTLRLTRDEIVHFQDERVTLRLQAQQEPAVRMINNVLFSLLSGDLSQLDTLFSIEGGMTKTGWDVVLRARESALAKAVGVLALEGNEYVRRVVIDDAGGDHTEITFSAIATGAAAISAEEAALF